MWLSRRGRWGHSALRCTGTAWHRGPHMPRLLLKWRIVLRRMWRWRTVSVRVWMVIPGRIAVGLRWRRVVRRFVSWVMWIGLRHHGAGRWATSGRRRPGRSARAGTRRWSAAVR